MTTNIPSKDEWVGLTNNQLMEVKDQLLNKYYDMRSINASFANAYLNYYREVEALINHREFLEFVKTQNPESSSIT